MSASLDKEEVRRFYRSAKTVSVAADAWAQDSTFLTTLNGVFHKTSFRKDQVSIIRLFIRCAKQVTEDEFTEALIDGELPPIKLTQNEMELLKGGDLGDLWSSLIR